MPKRKPKDPNRSPDLPHNWIERHIERLEALVFYDPIELTTWDCRRVRLVGEGQYEDVDANAEANWGTIRVGEMWGGEDITAVFRHKLTIPASHAGDNTYLDIEMDGGETQLTIYASIFLRPISIATRARLPFAPIPTSMSSIYGRLRRRLGKTAVPPATCSV